MAARVRRVLVAGATVVALLVCAVAADVAAAASVVPSPSPTAAADEPLVNWTWLGAGLGGAAVLLVVMYLLTRFFNNRGPAE
jgi:H+/gluconate symporter-like permease